MNQIADECLVFDGALTLRDAAAVQERFCIALARDRVISVACDEATAIDLSFVQLLIAARGSARSAGGSVTLASRPSGALLDTLTRAGFAVVRDGDEPASCFWFAGADS